MDPKCGRGSEAVLRKPAFPGALIKATWRKGEFGWNTYQTEADQFGGMSFALCPALLRFFEEPPKNLYAKVEAKA